jgi:hypothetical protein
VSSARFRRELAGGIAVSVDRDQSGAVERDGAGHRLRAWVVVEMPDDTADSLAHGFGLLAATTRIYG